MILPAVLEIDPKIQIQRMEELSQYSNIIHTDIMDGKFVKGKNLPILKALAKHESPVDLELHLMVRNPAKLFPDIRKIKKVKRIILQVESDWEKALKVYKKYYEVGIGVKLETSILEISKYQNIKISFILVFSITPGAQGNPFRPEVYKKVKEVKKMFPKIPIEIDGAMNPQRIRKLKKLGAKDFVVGSYMKASDLKCRMKILYRSE